MQVREWRGRELREETLTARSRLEGFCRYHRKCELNTWLSSSIRDSQIYFPPSFLALPFLVMEILF